MRKLAAILALFLAILTAPCAHAGIIRASAKGTHSVVKVGAKVVKQAAKLTYKVVY